ncbi:MAG: hypothetical protein IKR59_04275 [Lachnospiraceae bacterium]|nr:hypothetical protein [Lachnospiraceae bacterium]
MEYADIIDREHPVSEKHPPMPRLNRAAQFAPFAALTGYNDLIRESERETDARAELDESSIEALNRKLVWLLRQADPPEAAFTCFIPDGKKAGGSYKTVTGRLSRYDQFSRSVALDNGATLFIDDIREITIESPSLSLLL